MIDKAVEYNRKRWDAAATKEVQRLLGVEPDGWWGPVTVGAVIAWQGRCELVADGMVGPVTRASLRSSLTARTWALVDGHDLMTDLPALQTWQSSPHVARLPRSRTRKASSVNEIVVHESVTSSWLTTQRVLQRKGYGVHLMVTEDGSVTQHGDPATDRMVHCRGHNGPSVGVEVVNLYHPPRNQDGPWSTSMSAPWAHRDHYLLPTVDQCGALAEVIAWLVEVLPIPWVWHGFEEAHNRWWLHQLDSHSRAPGIWSHQQVGDHSDGSWPLLVAFLHLDRGMTIDDAWEFARVAATGVRRSATL